MTGTKPTGSSNESDDDHCPHSALDPSDCPECHVRRLTRDKERQRAQLREWVKANGPGGWIDDLRKRCSGETFPVAEPMARPLWTALDDLYALVRKQDMDPEFRGRIERAIAMARWVPRGSEKASEQHKVTE